MFIKAVPHNANLKGRQEEGLRSSRTNKTTQA
uniref:Uncharacterized protein n=1 Tax=viral metagenome TaxID=1070528 RepID=A0A6C0J011_9ZZZZ